MPEFEFRGTCPHCQTKLVVFARTTPGLNDQEEYACPVCNQIVGRVRCSNTPRVEIDQEAG